MNEVRRSGPSSNGKRVRHKGMTIPAEGENGVFTESWFPVCMSSEIKTGEIIGRPVLDGRIVIVRGEDGLVSVYSAYCPHLGADLSGGKIVEGRIQCPFHRWEFDVDGWCAKTLVGDPAPKNACLYKFHTVERFGLVWIFNGDEPWWEISDYPVADDELEFATYYDVPPVPVDPWVICCNTPDWQHLIAVHRYKFDYEKLYEKIEWTDHSMEFDMVGNLEDGSGPEIDARFGIYGTSFFRFHGTVMGQWVCALTGFHLLAPGKTQVFYSFGVKKSDGSPEDDARVAQTHAMLFQLGKAITSDDRPILHASRYVPGSMTVSDRALKKYLTIVRDFPRSHASAEFIK